MKGKKKVYWGYNMSTLPEVGEIISLTKVTLSTRTLKNDFESTKITIGPIVRIQRIADNMSILWTEKAGYAVYH